MFFVLLSPFIVCNNSPPHSSSSTNKTLQLLHTILLRIARTIWFIIQFPFALLNFVFFGKDSDYFRFFRALGKGFQASANRPVSHTPAPNFPESDQICISEAEARNLILRRESLANAAQKIENDARRIVNATDQSSLQSALDKLQNRPICVSTPKPLKSVKPLEPLEPIDVYDVRKFEAVTLPEERSEFGLLFIAPKKGILIEPHWTLRLLHGRVKNPAAVAIGATTRYFGVKANLTYAAEHPVSLHAVIFRDVADETCAIRRFSLYIWNGNKTLVAASGKLTLQKGVVQEQVFRLPTFVEAWRVRIVVHKNWGNENQTCFHGAAFAHAN